MATKKVEEEGPKLKLNHDEWFKRVQQRHKDLFQHSRWKNKMEELGNASLTPTKGAGKRKLKKILQVVEGF